MNTLGTSILLILTALRTRLWHVMPAAGARAAMVQIVATRVSRIAGRISRLYDRWRAGTLPKPRLGRPRAKRPANLARPKVSRAFLWLGTVGGVEARIIRSHLEAQIAQPDFAEFLAAAPQVGRMLRPLLHILGADPMPALLALPPRPRKPREKKPRFKRDAKPPRVYGGVVARNAVRDIAGNIKATASTVVQTDYRNSG